MVTAGPCGCRSGDVFLPSTSRARKKTGDCAARAAPRSRKSRVRQAGITQLARRQTVLSIEQETIAALEFGAKLAQ